MKVKWNGPALLPKVSRVGTCKYTLNIVALEFRLVLAAMQKSWWSFVENLCYLRIGKCAIIIVTYHFSAILVEVQKQWACFATKSV